MPRHRRPGLRALLRRQAELFSARTRGQPDPGIAPAPDTRTFYELDPATGHWRRL